MLESRRFAVAQIGARMHYAVPSLLYRANALDKLYTDLCADVGWGRILGQTIPNRFRSNAIRRLLSRTITEIPSEKIVAFNWFGLKRYLQGARAQEPASALRHLASANAEFGNLVARFGIGSANALYAFNAAALEIAMSAKRKGIWIALEQVGAPISWDELLLADERRAWPGWEHQGTELEDWKRLADRESREWALADKIVCASSFVVDRVRELGGPAEKCEVVPYGVDSARFSSIKREGRQKDEPLRVLCVATVQLRKGVHYLMQAAERLRNQNVRIRLVGQLRVADWAIRKLQSVMDVVGPVPRSAIREEFCNAHVFVLPTLSEGSATVCYEAIASGLPVITTPNAGSVIRDGREGYIVPIRDPEAIADRIASFEVDDDRLRQMSNNALLRAQEFDLDHYGNRLIRVLGIETSCSIQS